VSPVNAWLLDLGGLYAAIGEREMRHLLPDSPALHTIPRSPAYCRQVLIWEDEVVPVMDLARRIHPSSPAAAATRGPIAIIAFQGQPRDRPQHGTLLLSAPPVRARVSDAQACLLPEPASAWRRLASACFEQDGRGPFPVLDLARIFWLPGDGR
jgi:chemotaxis signal transduction protein